MATKTLDNTGTLPSPDFTTAQAWATYMSGLAALTAPEILQVYKAQYAEGRLFLNGPTTTATNNVVVEAYPGSENKGVEGTGARFYDTTGGSWGIFVPESNLAHLQFNDIEFLSNGVTSSQYSVHYSGTLPAGSVFNYDRCMCYDGVAVNNNQSANLSITLTNCIVEEYVGNTADPFDGLSTATAQYAARYCTFIKNSPWVTATNPAGMRYLTATNCVVMNFGGTSGWADFLNMDAASDYNASRDTTAPGTHSLHSLTDTDVFTGVGQGSWDLRPKTGSVLINAGTPISGITTDIAGNTRDASTPTIGAFEFVSVGPVTKKPIPPQIIIFG